MSDAPIKGDGTVVGRIRGVQNALRGNRRGGGGIDEEFDAYVTVEGRKFARTGNEWVEIDEQGEVLSPVDPQDFDRLNEMYESQDGYGMEVEEQRGQGMEESPSVIGEVGQKSSSETDVDPEIDEMSRDEQLELIHSVFDDLNFNIEEEEDDVVRKFAATAKQMTEAGR